MEKTVQVKVQYFYDQLSQRCDEIENNAVSRYEYRSTNQKHKLDAYIEILETYEKLFCDYIHYELD